MLPAQLTAQSFQEYPAEAKQLAVDRIALLQRLPLAFAPLLLRELIVCDWKFPAERRDLDKQFAYLSRLAPADFERTVAPFAQLRLSSEIEKLDWVNSPAAFSEQLSAQLWATHQIDAFRTAAVEYIAKANAAETDPPLPTHRLGIAVIGQGVAESRYSLFRKLKPQGTWFSRADPRDGMKVLLAQVLKRAAAHPAPYAHWRIDGTAIPRVVEDPLTLVSYGDLALVRAAVQARMLQSYQASVFDPETFRSTLARTGADQLGLNSTGDPLLNRFQLSLLTEGSGTQVFSTTFVQWAAREALRRAQPLTLFARFTPRQRERPMNELLAESQHKPDLDPQGSLIDADMGAYYTWLNQQRLTEAANATFLAWFEDHPEAIAIGPGFERGAHSDAPIALAELAHRVT